MAPSTALRQAAFDIAAGIRHQADLVAAREDDVRAYKAAGLNTLVSSARNGLTAAVAQRDRYVAEARETANPHMAAALKVYNVTL